MIVQKINSLELAPSKEIEEPSHCLAIIDDPFDRDHIRWTTVYFLCNGECVQMEAFFPSPSFPRGCSRGIESIQLEEIDALIVGRHSHTPTQFLLCAPIGIGNRCEPGSLVEFQQAVLDMLTQFQKDRDFSDWQLNEIETPEQALFAFQMIQDPKKESNGATNFGNAIQVIATKKAFYIMGDTRYLGGDELQEDIQDFFSSFKVL